MPWKIERATSEARAAGAEHECVVCHRVQDMPIPYVLARIVNCSKCAERLWLANSSPQGIPVFCFGCVPIEDITTVMLTERQMRDIAARRGPAVDDIERLRQRLNKRQ